MNFILIFFNLFSQSDYFSKALVLSLVVCTIFLFVFFIYGYFKILYKKKAASLLLKKIHNNESITDRDGEIAIFLIQSTVQYQKNKEDVFFLMVDRFLLSEYRLKIIFGVFASIGPLLGLLGTIWGIIAVFLNLEGAADLTAIAPGIAEGLITTAAGLFLAIPALCMYHFFNYLLQVYYGLISSIYYLFVEKAV